MINLDNTYIKSLDLNLMSFVLELFDLEYFREEFLSVSNREKFKCGVTYYVHILSPELELITDNIAFVYPEDVKLDQFIVHLHKKICNKNLYNLLDSRKSFWLHIGTRSLNHLDFELYHLNSFYKHK